MPADLTDEQAMQLDAALANAARDLAALPPGEAEDATFQEAETAALAESAPEALEETRQVIDIIGEADLRRHVGLFLAYHLGNLQKVQQAHEEKLFQFEQGVYRQTGETFQRMTRNMNAAYGDLDRLLHPKTPEDHAYLEECLRDVEDYLGI